MMGRPRPAEQREVVARYRPIEEIIPGRWAQGMVEANGIRHHYYRTGGEKPALVLLHGLQESGLTWLRVARALERDYDVVMPDARGHGRSDRAGEQFSEEVLRDDAAGLIRALGLERPALLGHSMGASTAALVGAAYPELVRAVLLEDPVWEARPGAEFVKSPGNQAEGWGV
jgi:N-formylmaleamate deformylase